MDTIELELHKAIALTEVKKDKPFRRNHAAPIETVLDCAALACNMPLDKMLTSARKRELVYGRIVASVYLRRNLCLPLITVGNIFNRNHCSILHYQKQYDILTEIKAQDFLDIRDSFLDLIKQFNPNYTAIL